MTNDVHSPWHVADADLDDLRSRLARGRWPTAWPVPGWHAGTDPVELARLVEYWRTGYDWRAQEAAINALPPHFVDIDGIPSTSCATKASTPTPSPSCSRTAGQARFSG